MRQVRKRVYEWLEPGEQGHALEHAFDYLLIFMILSSVVVVVLESMPEMAGSLGLLMEAERWLVYFFSAEYALRLWTCPEAGKYGEGWRARLRYASSLMALVDLAAVAPYFLMPMVSSDTVVMRLLRIFRLVRVFKFGRYHASIGILGRVLRLRRAELTVSLFLVLALVTITSTLMYAVEHDAQPKAFASIPASMWWGVVTLTTVGYGDVYPITAAGKVVAGISVLLGVGLFAIPAGLLASGFTEELAREKRGECKKCPHCGGEL
jgi:voltage-gated potassium channel